MLRKIPSGVKTIAVKDYFKIRKDYSNNLRLRLRENGYWQAEYLPEIEEDIRPNKGKSKSGKRLTIRKSMETKDPDIAAKLAVEWNIEKRRTDTQLRYQIGGSGKTLETYWEDYLQKEVLVKETKRNFKRWYRDETLKWNSENFGLKHQPFSKISVDKISSSHLVDYFKLLEDNAKKKNGSNGRGMKEQQKTFINKLFSLASVDFVGHYFPDFPVITKQTKQVRHLRKEEWETLIRGVFELGLGQDSKCYSPEDYWKLDFKKNNRDNIRNWIDLYDALNLEWYFYLRAEDMYRIKGEWFTETKDGWFCDLQILKGDRSKYTTTHYREDAISFMKRLSARKPKGYLIQPHIERPEGNPASCSVLRNLNFLLKIAMKKFVPDFPENEIKWTNIRHTAFRLTLEDDPSLGTQPAINSFAANGNTSVEQLQDTYLKYIEQEKTALKSRSVIKKSTQVRWGDLYKNKKDVPDLN